MESVSVTQIQELVRQLPEEKLPHAYRLLRELADQPGSRSPQMEFMQLPLDERRRLLTEQAAEMANHFEQTADKRQEWQGGDFQDEH